MDDLYTIDTPENIEFAYDIAGIGSRFLAAIVDTLLIALAEVLVFAAAGVIANGAGVFDTLDWSESVVIAIAGLVGFLILWGYYIIFEMVWSGQTPGKRLIGLRVVREGGRPITFISSALRNFIRLVDFLPAFYGIGVVVMFIDPRARRLGDLAGGTLVVKERRGVTLESLTANTAPMIAPPRPGETMPAPSLQQVHMLTDQDYTLVQEFLRRREQLGRDARFRLGAQLASGLQARLGLPQGGDAEAFLHYVVAQYQLYQHAQGAVKQLPNQIA
ncbi:MAG: RDD family protein [Roseiflexaceae bacterium]|nr:RDD family protein [Roseiflexaceae bacterium]